MLVTPCLEHRGKTKGEERPSETSARDIGALCPSLSVTWLTKQRQSRSSSPISARMGLRPPKGSKETRALDFSKCGLWLQTPQPKALEDQSSGGYSCLGL